MEPRVPKRVGVDLGLLLVGGGGGLFLVEINLGSDIDFVSSSLEVFSELNLVVFLVAESL